ncbi:hypothetical protein [Hydrogenophaga sp.]|uniref:hypothetical protein n=1 Tax=Hydrogenophaga sp. TaxID=1904254 RepID=UPI003D146FAC
MPSSRQTSPPWPSRARAGFFIGLAVALASAQAQPMGALDAADPVHPGTPPPPLVLPTTVSADTPAPPDNIAQARAIWQRANQRVAEFPRGHIDLLRWESRQPDDTATTTSGAQAAPGLDFAQALRLSLRHRPELFTHADMNALARAQVRVAYAGHVRELRRAWIDAIATRQRERLLGDVLDATRSGSELGRRMVTAGNWSQARQMREQLIEASAWQASVSARGAAIAAQERLAQKLGLWEAQTVSRLGEQLPPGLPTPPAQPEPGEGLSPAMLEATALSRHPTLANERLLAQRELAVPVPSRQQAWRDAVTAALDAMPEPGPTATPPHIADLNLLRDHAVQRAASAEAALLRQASERRSMARQAWAALQLRHATALHAQDVVARLQTSLEQETLLRYNGMLQSSWELLASARERLASLDAALLARRDFWHAQADWQAVLAGADYAGPDTSTSSSATTVAPAGH